MSFKHGMIPHSLHFTV